MKEDLVLRFHGKPKNLEQAWKLWKQGRRFVAAGLTFTIRDLPLIQSHYNVFIQGTDRRVKCQ